MIGGEEKSVKDLTGREVKVGDKIIRPFKVRSGQVPIYEVVGFSNNGGILIPSITSWAKSKTSSIRSSFVKVENRDGESN